MKKPDFLIVGAMKAGTTTLYEDLSRIDGIYLPPEKEPEDLIYDVVETDVGFNKYCSKFSAAPSGHILGEASTAYTKLPTYRGVAKRAHNLLGPDLKVIYLTRDPIKRIVSQYHHLWGLGLEKRSINTAVLEDETYVAYSAYDYQIQPWVDAFGQDNILIIPFERYVINRQSMVNVVCNFLGVPSRQAALDVSIHRNKSTGKRVVREGSVWSKMVHSEFYLYSIKPLLPMQIRDWCKSLLLPKVRKLDQELTTSTIQALNDRLSRM